VRKNIFEILSENFDVAHEIKTIWRLFTKEACISIPNEYDIDDDLLPILDFVNSYSFMNWKSRSRSASTLDMMKRLGINDRFVDELSAFSDNVLLILEFIMNIFARCEIAIKELNFEVNNEYQILNENIVTFIEHFGYETYNFLKEEQVIIIEKNPAAISAAEISEPETAKKIIQYNHYTLKGDIETKKTILISLANEIEPRKKELEKINPSLSNDLFFMFNNVNLRHNNVEPTNKTHYKPFVANMDKNTLESWYDETYQMILLAKLLLDNVARTSNIKILKENIIGAKGSPETGNIAL
jgi:hypothetical protein